MQRKILLDNYDMKLVADAIKFWNESEALQSLDDPDYDMDLWSMDEDIEEVIMIALSQFRLSLKKTRDSFEKIVNYEKENA